MSALQVLLPLFQEAHSDATGVLELARVLSPSETSWRRLLWYVLAGSRGGPNRGRIVTLLREGPKNVNQLAEALNVHYRVAEHHIRALGEESPSLTFRRKIRTPLLSLAGDGGAPSDL